ETYRTLAELYKRRGDAWSALYCTEQGLVYYNRDQDLLQRKDSGYYSVTPQELEARMEGVRKWFDVEYCKHKARWILEQGGEAPERLDWAGGLGELDLVRQPAGLAVRVLCSRILRRRGELQQYKALLEEVRNNTPEKFASGEDEEAWYTSCKRLGEIYPGD